MTVRIRMKGRMMRPNFQYVRSETPLKKAAQEKVSRKSPNPTWRLELNMAVIETATMNSILDKASMRWNAESPF
jgi:hypothetical protein